MPKNETLILFMRKKIHTYARGESLLSKFSQLCIEDWVIG